MTCVKNAKTQHSPCGWLSSPNTHIQVIDNVMKNPLAPNVCDSKTTEKRSPFLAHHFQSAPWSSPLVESIWDWTFDCKKCEHLKSITRELLKGQSTLAHDKPPASPLPPHMPLWSSCLSHPHHNSVHLMMSEYTIAMNTILKICTGRVKHPIWNGGHVLFYEDVVVTHGHHHNHH